MDTRIEIYKDGLWQTLQLENDAVIKYNAVINRVGKVASREISHTNTFSLPYIYTNIQILGLNQFNPALMAKAMNAKYIARYYVEEKILQEGFIVLNNTNGGNINLNFIDEALSIVELWGETSYEELLKNDTIEFPADYQTAIDDLRDYSLPTSSVPSHLNNVGSRGYPIALYPNNLNQIGDTFNRDEDGIRHDNHVNPFQSRPVFNVKAFLDLITESFDYTPVYDSSVDWALIAETYMTSDGANQNKEADSSTDTIFNGTTATVNAHAKSATYIGDSGNYIFSSRTFFLVGQNPYQETWPINMPGYYWPTYMRFNQPGGSNTYNQKPILYRPDFSNGYSGAIRWTADVPGAVAHDRRVEITVWWRSSNSGSPSIPVRLDPIGGTAVSEITFGTEYDFDMTFQKSYFSAIPSGAIYLQGVTVDYHRHGQFNNQEHRLINMRVEETVLQGDVVSFDEFDQYAPTSLDLTYAASKKTVKKLISAIMHKEGILMNINNKTKQVKFFNYNHYATQRDNENYSNWTNMFLEYNKVKYNTDYGNAFGTLNHISLSDPFQGNFYPILLTNQGDLSKYKEFEQNEVKDFKDVSNVVYVDNSTKEDWYEYEIDGLGLVEKNGTIPSIFCMRADGTTQGSILNLPKLANVNYGQIPDGVASWYQLVDNAIRVEAEFLLTIDTIRDLDLSKPIYIEQLGGYYIIEEVREYTNSITPTKVKLIKLIDEIVPKSVQNNDPKLTTIGGSKTPTGGGTKYEIGSYVNKLDYSISSGTITARQYNAHPNDGGTLTGLSFSETIDNTTSQFNADPTTAVADDLFLAAFSETSVTASQEGWYDVTVELRGTATGFAATTTPTISSTTNIVYLGDTAVPTPELRIEFNVAQSEILEDGKAAFDYKLINYLDDTDISVTCEFQKLTGPNGTNVGSLVTDNGIPNLVESTGTIEMIFPEINQFYRVIFKTTEADSVSNDFDGFYVI
jgi:hypothetical protein